VEEDTMPYNIPDHVENPAAYENAIRERIKANAWKTKRANFERDYPDLQAKLQEVWYPAHKPCCYDRVWDEWGRCGTCGDATGTAEWTADGSHLALEHFTPKQLRALGRKLSWLRDGYEQYGSLTEKQIAKAEEIMAETVERVQRYEDEDERRKAGATPWENGRQEFPCTVVSLKLKDVPKHSYYDSGVAWKMIVQREDGSRLYCTAPSRLIDEAYRRAQTEFDNDKIELSGRGMKLVLRANVTRADDDPIFAFGKRPHIVSIEGEEK
jgi:hypothetical protein